MKASGHSIQVGKIGKSVPVHRVWISVERPDPVVCKAFIDSWTPGLAPSSVLMEDYKAGRIGWDELSLRYLCQLRSPQSQDLLRPLALLSKRKTIAFLCDCTDPMNCIIMVAAKALEDCRMNGNFVMSCHGDITQ